MTHNTTSAFDTIRFDVFVELSNSFVTAVSDILTAAYAIAKSGMTTLKIWEERASHRGQMLDLNSLQLNDIGLTRGQVLADARKPFWRG